MYGDVKQGSMFKVKMMKKLSVTMLVGFMLFFSACSTTDVTSAWYDEQYAGGPVKKVLVLGVFKTANVRRVFEDGVVAGLVGKNVEAVASYRIFSIDDLVEKDAIVAKIQASDFDSVIISRVVDKRTKETYSRAIGSPTYNGHRWDNYYAQSFGQLRSPSYASPFEPEDGDAVEIQRQNIYSLETNLYHVENKGLILSLMTDIYAGQAQERLVSSLVKTLVGKYSENGLI